MKIRQRFLLGFYRGKIKLLAAFSKRKAAEEAFRLFCTPFFTNVVSKPLIYLQAKPVKFLSHGRKIKGYRCQKSEDKRLLIIHGFASASYKFEKYIISLMNKGYEVLAFDAPAHGQSQGKTINVIQYKDMIEKAVAKFGPIDMYIAHSFGGLALSLALENIPHDENTKVTMLAPLTETSTTIDKFLEKLDIKDPEIRSEMDGIILRMSYQTAEWFSIKRAMRNINAKVLWIHDEDDDITPISDVKHVQEKDFRNITFHITKELGHHKIYQDNEVREMVIDFL